MMKILFLLKADKIVYSSEQILNHFEIESDYKIQKHSGGINANGFLK